MNKHLVIALFLSQVPSQTEAVRVTAHSQSQAQFMDFLFGSSKTPEETAEEKLHRLDKEKEENF
jgi:hypothetical protein